MVLTLSLSLNVCDNCDSAENLVFLGNQLTGSIPSELGGLSQLGKYGHLRDSLHFNFIILILLFCGIDTFSFSQCL